VHKKKTKDKYKNKCGGGAHKRAQHTRHGAYSVCALLHSSLHNKIKFKIKMQCSTLVLPIDEQFEYILFLAKNLKFVSKIIIRNPFYSKSSWNV
jgi:hypothetical protein